MSEVEGSDLCDCDQSIPRDDGEKSVVRGESTKLSDFCTQRLREGVDLQSELRDCPAGCTVIECKLENDRPIARVLRVSANGEPGLSLRIETRNTTDGPSSRVISRPAYNASKDERVAKPTEMSYCLESRERPDGMYAKARRVAVKGPLTDPELVTEMETTDGTANRGGQLARVLCAPGLDDQHARKTERVKTNNEPIATIIECSASSDGPVARVVQRVPGSGKNNAKYRYESFVNKKNKKPAVLGTKFPVNDDSSDYNVIETRVDPDGPYARVAGKVNGENDTKYCAYLESKLREGPSAKLTQMVMNKKTCDVANGFSNSIELSACEERGCNVPDRIRPCQDEEGRQVRAISRPSMRSDKIKVKRDPLTHGCCIGQDDDYPPADPSASLPAIQRTKSTKSVKKEKSLATRASAKERNGAMAIFARQETDFVTPTTDELLTSYKDFYSEYRIEKYCKARSKRNGLQDDIFLPIPASVIELNKKKLESLRRDYAPLMSKKLMSLSQSKHSLSPSSHGANIRSITSKFQGAVYPQKRERKPLYIVPLPGKPVKRIKSVELLNGIIRTDCDCYHRNGLQKECRRRRCGVPECYVEPNPRCTLGTYFTKKWDKYYKKVNDKFIPAGFSGNEKQWKQASLDAWDRKIEAVRFRHIQTGDPAKREYREKIII